MDTITMGPNPNYFGRVTMPKHIQKVKKKPVTEKVCIKCNTERSLAEFKANDFFDDGYNRICKSCKPKFITISRLKGERHWTEKLIRDVLGEPDSLARNPHYGNAPPMKLYDLERVKECEKNITLPDKALRTRRKNTAKKAVDTKIKNIIHLARTCKINTFFDEDWGYRNRRQIVNYLRHECTSYDYELASKYGVTGVQIFHDIIKNRILRKIIKRYPKLKDVASSQFVKTPYE